MRAADISDDISEVLLTEEQIHEKLAELATQVAADYEAARSSSWAC